MKTKKTISILLALLFGATLIFGIAAPSSASAFQLLPTHPTGTCPEGVEKCDPSCNYSICDFLMVFDNIVKLIVGASGSLALLFLVISGIRMIIAGGKSEEIEKARKSLVATIVGVAIILLSWTIVHAIFGLMTGRFTEGNWSAAPWASIDCGLRECDSDSDSPGPSGAIQKGIEAVGGAVGGAVDAIGDIAQ